MPSTRTCEWLPQIAHFNIFVHAHKNANEPATSLPQVRNCGRTPAAVVLSVMAVVIPLLDADFAKPPISSTTVSRLQVISSWQATGKINKWRSAHCGLRQVSLVAPTPAANLATRRGEWGNIGHWGIPATLETGESITLTLWQ